MYSPNSFLTILPRLISILLNQILCGRVRSPTVNTLHHRHPLRILTIVCWIFRRTYTYHTVSLALSPLYSCHGVPFSPEFFTVRLHLFSSSIGDHHIIPRCQLPLNICKSHESYQIVMSHIRLL